MILQEEVSPAFFSVPLRGEMLRVCHHSLLLRRGLPEGGNGRRTRGSAQGSRRALPVLAEWLIGSGEEMNEGTMIL